MATSGSYDWTVTRDNIIKAALQTLKVIDPDGTPTTAQVNSAAVVLNAMVKAWRPDAPFLWSLEETTQALTPADIVVGTDGNDYKCIKDHTSGASTRPITGSDWTSYWIATGTTGEGSTWVTSTAYNSIQQYSLAAEVIGIDRPFLRDSNGVDTPLTTLTREGYMSIGSKYTEGKPHSIWFSRELGQPKVIMFPVPPNDSVDVLHYDAVKKPQDFDAANDNPDFTEEWFEALYLGVAARLGRNYNLPVHELRDLREEARVAKAIAMSSDNENTSLQISPA